MLKNINRKYNILYYLSIGLYSLLALKVKLLDGALSRRYLILTKEYYKSNPDIANPLINLVPLVNLVPFRKIYIRTIVGNILFSIPLGFLVYAKTKNIKITLLISFIVSLGLESLQYILLLGVFDINTIIFNVLGSILGILVFEVGLIFYGKAMLS